MIQFQNQHITIFQSALYMTTTAIIQTKKAVIMTDPTWLPKEIETIKHHVDEMIGDRQLYIIYTHSDFDHIIGAGAFPEAKVIATRTLHHNLNKEEVLQEIEAFDQKYYLKRNYKPIYPSADIIVSQDAQTLQLGEVTLTFYLAPGHTKDSLFTVIEPYGIFLAGDYLSDVEFPFVFSSYKDYVETIRTAERILEDHLIRVLVPGHGTATQNEDEIISRLYFSKYYLKELSRNNDSLIDVLRNKYTFFDGMKSIHFDNISLARR
ncbi:MBL fold metallo-hydrolase [Oceanobacillus alkalisoli]|uniref:MBL fold metallo-hydrolase n=1 Tax=Oceanobacillus alkalisoli TaxID=2925113 RepID=UPI001EF02762|nr:MBL fold metallo-hydrolase [Oceanobacillus alkalisoli]MCF3943743.1 MBL fold metallo-hydrolase [Oceanobacillus alkalisoli]MCG5103683.1 MBL fold metallo-hydrolase [Oceanobacillus alkalisoli]